MADEFNTAFSVRYTNGELSQTITQSKKFNQTTKGWHSPVVTVNTSAEEDLSIGDIGTEGFLYLKNLDATNYVTWGPKSGGSMVAIGRLKAGEYAWIRMDSSATLRWQANTAAVKVQVCLFED